MTPSDYERTEQGDDPSCPSIEPTYEQLRTRVAKLEAALEEARGIAKTFWLVHRHSYIADADALCSMCEGIADAIAALKDAPQDEPFMPRIEWPPQ